MRTVLSIAITLAAMIFAIHASGQLETSSPLQDQLAAQPQPTTEK